MSYRFVKTFVSRLALVLGLALVTSPMPLAHAAKEPAAAKKPAKGGAKAKAKPAAAKPQAKAGDKAKAKPKAAKAAPKATKAKADAKAAKPKADAKTAKPKAKAKDGKKSLAAKAKVDPNAEMDEFESDAGDQASTSPLLFVFVLFIAGCVGGYYYMKRKQQGQGGAAPADGDAFASAHDAGGGDAFVSDLSSLGGDRTDKKPVPDKLAAGFSGAARKGVQTAARGAVKTALADVPSDFGKAPSGLASRAGDLLGKPEAAASPRSTVVMAPPTTTAASEETVTPPDAIPEALAQTACIEGAPEAPAPTEKSPSAVELGVWNDLSLEDFWYRVKLIEQAGIDGGDEAYEAKIRELGLRDKEHFDQVKDTYLAQRPDAHSDMQAMANATMRVSREKMQGAVSPELFAPIEGVSLEVYAKVMARRGGLPQGDDAALAALYIEHGVDAETFARADAGWQKRMGEVADPYAAGALMSEYGKHFAAGTPSRFQSAATAGAAVMGPDAPVGQNPDGEDPVSFERFVEIRTAQACWAEQGKDVAAMLEATFGMTILDWSAVSQYWSQKFLANVHLVEQDHAFEAKYRGIYGAA